MRFNIPPKVKKHPHRINEEIQAREVRLIDEEKKQVGVIPIDQALALARQKELDLVEISPEASPPVCRLLNYGKFLYSLQKKAHEAQRHQRKVQIKEIKFTPVIGEHDIEVKLRKIREFLQDGNKVKVTVWLRGRQKRKPEMLDMMVAAHHGNFQGDGRHRIAAEAGDLQLPYFNRSKKRRKRCQN